MFIVFFGTSKPPFLSDKTNCFEIGSVEPDDFSFQGASFLIFFLVPVQGAQKSS